MSMNQQEFIGQHNPLMLKVTYFDSFGLDDIPKEISKFIGNKNITTNIYRIKAYDSIMCGCFCIGFTDFMLKGKTL